MILERCNVRHFMLKSTVWHCGVCAWHRQVRLAARAAAKHTLQTATITTRKAESKGAAARSRPR